MRDKFLIYCNFIGGHQLEYVHHLYMGALGNPSKEYVFVVPIEFKNVSGNLHWPEANHISFDFVGENNQTKGNGIIKRAFINSKRLGGYVKKHEANHVVLISLIDYLPFLPLFVPSYVKVRGVLYRIYLYDWKSENLIKKTLDVAKFLLMSRFDVFERVFILNDNTAASYLNKLYKCSKFQYLADPVSSLQSYHPKSIRLNLKIPSNNVVYLHPGGMLRRKGTLEILRAIVNLNEEYCKNLTFIFAGRITEEIDKEFRSLIERLKTKVQIILLEGFLPFERLADLFESSDFILIPYKDNSKSSGIVGHADFYRKPVVVARGGVIGKLVRNWHLGFLLDKANADCIKSFLEASPSYTYKKSSYLETHSVEIFNNAILNI